LDESRVVRACTARANRLRVDITDGNIFLFKYYFVSRLLRMRD
jgi:hypothetical protein